VESARQGRYDDDEEGDPRPGAALAATGGAAFTISDSVAVDGGARVGLSDTAPDWGLFATLTIALGAK
jgi:hypothetical protein